MSRLIGPFVSIQLLFHFVLLGFSVENPWVHSLSTQSLLLWMGFTALVRENAGASFRKLLDA